MSSHRRPAPPAARDGDATFAAVDLGASSGRVVLGSVRPDADGPDALVLREAHRFPNRPVEVRGTLYWDVLDLYRGVLDGLRAAGRLTGGAGPAGVGIDGWAVDHGLLDENGNLLSNPVHYRDGRVAGTREELEALLPAAELYAATGIQHLPFNTVYQLLATRGTPAFREAHRVVLLPDLISYWLTGLLGTELTNASTTQLLDPRTGDWSPRVTEAIGLDTSLFPPLRRPGDPAGELLPEVLAGTGLPGPVPVTTVASHDTASAVAAVPAASPRFGYIATGTWSLAGVELDAPVLTEASRLANFTNELGLDSTVRHLRNIMGLWLLEECRRTWEAEGPPAPLADLLAQAALVPGPGPVVDAGDPAFVAPGGMPARIAEACRRGGQRAPRDRAETVRCVLDSLALAHREAIADAERLSGRTVDVVHVVGGGARNELLCRLTADACGRPVVAGPAEAAAVGNVLCQARTAGIVPGGPDAGRALLRRALPLVRYRPRGSGADWQRAAERAAQTRKER
ncbi:FGGY-family carbohydrate kinase [Streptomyces spiramenti]|uniref:Rhamnulokinase n=1 Tax=Streptomyces spiramenti TaxID=2720606 RepID=A0ABX1AVX1_9ACTN|nr:rhamnulokinase [Streptomyces spiramenti]